MTNRQVALYTLVRLLPQADAGEFANIGVVIACPQQRRFEFRLIKRHTRVARFFDEFAGDLFRRYVQRDAQDVQQRREELLERAVRGVLLQQNLRGAFAADEIGPTISTSASRSCTRATASRWQ